MAKYFPGHVNEALAIVTAESGGNPLAINKNTNASTDFGLMQINSVHARRVHGDLASLYDPETNVKVARQIWLEQSWCPWSSSHKVGLCK